MTADQAAPPAVTADTILVRSNRLARARDRSGREGVLNESVGRLVRVNEGGWKFLELFREPVTPRSAALAGGISSEALPRMLEVVATFVSRGLLVAPGEDDYLYLHGRALREDAAPPLVAGAPRLFQAAAQPADAEFVFFGVPLDRGSASPGAAAGPARLRAVSAHLPSCDPRCDALPGVWDAATESWRLCGARLGDLGDIAVRPTESLEATYRDITRAIERGLHGTHGVPIALGGDHSITWPVICALPQAHIFLVQFDAHADLNDYLAGGPHDHANVISRLLRESRVDGVLQVGVRDVSAPWRKPGERVEQLGAYRAARMSPVDIVSRIPEDAVCYVTIDIDVLDPATAPATGHPLPGGLALDAVEAVLETLGARRRLVGADLVEIVPALPGAGITVVSGLRLLMRLCDGVRTFHGRGQA